MRPRFTRLVGLAAASALFVAPVATALPAQAADPGYGTVKLKVVDANGDPVRAQVALVDPVGGLVSLADSPVLASTYTHAVAVGSYSVVVIGGWGALTCKGIVDCSISVFSGAGGPQVSTPVIEVTEGDKTTYTVKTAIPKVVGTGKVGSPLTLKMPAALVDLAAYVRDYVADVPEFANLSSKPGVTWLRNGRKFGPTGLTYKPRSSDSGRKIQARVTYPPLLEVFWSQGFGAAAVPAPLTTNAVKVTKVKPSLTLKTPATVKKGTRPDAWVTVRSGRMLVSGVVQLKVGQLRPSRVALRSGFAKFKLPKLSPGTYTVTAKFIRSGSYSAVKTTKKVRVTG